MSWAFRRPGLAVVAATGAGLVLATLVALASGPAGLVGTHLGPGAFYAVVPYLLMLVPALVVSAFVLAVLLAGPLRSWHEAGRPWRALLDGRLWLVAGHEALTLRWLGGGGGGCYYPDPWRASGARRALHGLVVGGLAAAFAATAVAAVYQDMLGWLPPYPVLSPPVLLGTAGGAAIITGCTGLLLLKPRRGDDRAGAAARAMDVAFLAVLDAAAITGMLTLALRSTPALGVALVAHLACLAALYVTAPYGKLVHGGHRLAALLVDAAERRADGA